MCVTARELCALIIEQRDGKMCYSRDIFSQHNSAKKAYYSTQGFAWMWNQKGCLIEQYFKITFCCSDTYHKCIMVAIIPVCNVPRQQCTNTSDVLPTAAVQVLYCAIYMHPYLMWLQWQCDYTALILKDGWATFHRRAVLTTQDRSVV